MENLEKAKELVIECATKVVQYPIGSIGYDPCDMMNLEIAIGNLQELKARLGI